MSLKRGDIVILPFPWTNLKSYSLRPALVISDDSFNNNNDDAVFMFITKIHYKSMFDYRLKTTDSSFKNTGLKKASTFRISKIMTLEQNLVLRLLGQTDKKLLKKLESGLKLLLNL